MKFTRALWVAVFCALYSHTAFAGWTLYRFEGRDYVSLDDIAAFYGFPKPPAVTAPASPAPAVPGAPSATPARSRASIATEFGLALRDLTDPDAKPIALDSGTMQLEVTPGLREARINGVKQWLAFPVHQEGEKILVSRLDLSKVIEPRLRPELIEGFQPVTTVVLDPGHGGHDNGAPSRYGYEKDFALDVALRARKLLEAAHYKVVMTRASDVFIPLEQRPAPANHLADSIFISIHFNSSNSNLDARGFEIFSMAPRGAPATNDTLPRERDMRAEPGNASELQSGALAGSIYHSLLGQVPMEDRGIKYARFAVLRLCSVPAVLIECGFMSNNAESALVGTPAWRQRVAEAITDGVESYKLLAERKQRPKVIADYRRGK
jgi:N-acetylmuramoyl-L-alanine amidase